MNIGEEQWHFAKRKQQRGMFVRKQSGSICQQAGNIQIGECGEGKKETGDRAAGNLLRNNVITRIIAPTQKPEATATRRDVDAISRCSPGANSRQILVEFSSNPCRRATLQSRKKENRVGKSRALKC